MAAQLLFTDAEREEFKKYFFDLADKNGDKKITRDELGAAYKAIGIPVTQEKLTKLMSEMDKDGSGTIDISEVLMRNAFKAEQWHESEAEKRYVKAFDAVDKDGNGSLSPVELHTALSACTEPMSKEAIDEIIAKADCNKDGKINREEFVKLFKSS